MEKFLTCLEQRYDALGLFPKMHISGKIFTTICLVVVGFVFIIIWFPTVVFGKVLATLGLFWVVTLLWMLVEDW